MTAFRRNGNVVIGEGETLSETLESGAWIESDYTLEIEWQPTL